MVWTVGTCLCISTGISITLSMYCSSEISNLWNFGLRDHVIDFSPGWSNRDPWQTVRSLPGSGYLLNTFVLIILTSTVSSTCLVTWEKGRMLSLRRSLEYFGLLHLHWVDGWLDMCVHNLFNHSLLDPVMRQSAIGTVCTQLAARFSELR